MALVAAKCTQCGGSLQVDDSKDAGICPFCGTAFVTEKVINNYHCHITNNIDTVIVQNSEKAELKERCRAYLESKSYPGLYDIAYKGIGQYPNELFFFACCLFSIMQMNPKKINYGVFLNFESLFDRAFAFVDKATDWEKGVLNAAEDYHTNSALQIEYDKLTFYYQHKYHISYDKAVQLKKKKDVAAEVKNAFASIRSIFLFWIPLIILIGLVIVSIVFGEYELSDNAASSPLFYIMVVGILYSVVAFISTFSILRTSIRDRAKMDRPVVETLADYLNRRIQY